MRFLKFILPLLLVTTTANASFYIPDGAVTTSKLSTTAINGLTTVTTVGNDFVSISDTSDSNKNKKALVSDIKNAVYRSVTTTDSVGVDDETMKMSGSSFTSTLPTAVGVAGKKYKYIHAGTFGQVYTLATTSAQTIGGIASGSYALYTPGEALSIESDGANWIVTHHYTNTDWVSDTSCAMNYWTFTITSGSATLAATYTNNGATFVVAKTVASGVTLITMTTSGAPAASGTLTKASGTGDATLTFSTRTGANSGLTATTTNPTAYGSPITNACKWRREGRYAVIWLNYYQTSAGVIGSGDFIFPMPTNMSIDTSVTGTFNTGSGEIGNVAASLASFWLDSCHGVSTNQTTPLHCVAAVPYSSSQYRVYLASTTVNVQPINSGFNGTQYSNLVWNFVSKFPISGWQP